MPTKASASKGTQLLRGNGATPTEGFTLVAEVLNAKLDAKLIMSDATSLDSTAAEMIPHIVGWGTISGALNFVDTDGQQAGLLSDLQNGTKRNFKLVFPTQSNRTVTIAGYVSKFDWDFQVNKTVTSNFAITITGPAVIS
jgi:hypothetical protein